MNIKKILSFEWDAIAGIIAAVAAIILHLLHVVDEQVILPIMLALLGLLFINFMRHAKSNESTAEQVDHAVTVVDNIQATLQQPGVVLVGPRHLRSTNEEFIRNMSGEVVWYNVCLSMYQPPPLFEALLRPALDNPMVTSIRFVLDESQQSLWQEAIQPKIEMCAGNSKVREPRWCHLSKTVSFILGDSRQSGGTEALLSFWGEPFMAQSSERDVPRYIFHIQKNSELLPHLVDLERGCGR